MIMMNYGIPHALLTCNHTIVLRLLFFCFVQRKEFFSSFFDNMTSCIAYAKDSSTLSLYLQFMF